MHTSLRNKIIFLASNNSLTAYKIAKGSGISVTTVSQIIDKKNKKNFKESTLLAVLRYLEAKTNQLSKTTEAKILENKEALKDMSYMLKKIEEIKEKTEKIEILDQKIDHIFEFLKGGSDQLTMSIISIEKTKQMIHEQTNHFDEKIKGFNLKN